MTSEISERAKELEQLCIDYRVQRLDLFGSAVTGQYNPEESGPGLRGRVPTVTCR